MPSNEIYRDMYSKALNGLRWDVKRYEVHHLDGDHKHNEIENLVLLPMALHKRLHTYHRMVNSQEYLANCFSLNPLDSLDKFLFVTVSMSARKFFLVKEEEKRFVQLRDFIRNSEWAELNFNHDFEKYFKLFDSDLHKKYE